MLRLLFVQDSRLYLKFGRNRGQEGWGVWLNTEANDGYGGTSRLRELLAGSTTGWLAGGGG